jgi:hypothetical protein
VILGCSIIIIVIIAITIVETRPSWNTGIGFPGFHIVSVFSVTSRALLLVSMTGLRLDISRVSIFLAPGPIGAICSWRRIVDAGMSWSGSSWSSGIGGVFVIVAIPQTGLTIVARTLAAGPRRVIVVGGHCYLINPR